nr:hypothetical protein [Clostridia bacterium]
MDNSIFAPLEELYSQVMPWITSMYEEESGGFYATRSGKDDPEMFAGIEMSSSALANLKEYSGMWSCIPDSTHKKLTEFYTSRFNRSSGWFEDKCFDGEDRSRARTQAAAERALSRLGVKYDRFKNNAESQTTAPVLPEYFAAPESYVEWIKTLPWQTNSWFAGDRVQSSQVYVQRISEDRRQAYIDAMFDYVKSVQSPETGFFGERLTYNALSGAFKIDLICSQYKLELPNHRKILNSVFRVLEEADATTACYIRNSMDLLRTMTVKYNCGDEIRAKLPSYIPTIVNAAKQVKAPDGGFSSSRGRALEKFGGVKAGRGLNESDMDGTSMLMIARRSIYEIMETELPSLAHTMPEMWELIK